VTAGNLIYAGFAANRTDCPRIYAASRINLNITSEQLLTALPVRVFDVLACGGFLLTDEREDARMLFEPGKELVIYSGVDDLAKKIRYYLAHQEERGKILDAGMKRVFADYSFDAIIPSMLERASSEHHPVPRTSGMKWPVHSLLATWLFCASCMRNGDFSEARILVDRLLSHAGTNELALAAACLHAALTGNNFLAEEFLRRLMLIHEYWEGMSGAVRAALRERHFSEWDSLYRRFAELTRAPSGN
jgi:hypothetical protein